MHEYASPSLHSAIKALGRGLDEASQLQAHWKQEVKVGVHTAPGGTPGGPSGEAGPDADAPGPEAPAAPAHAAKAAAPATYMPTAAAKTSAQEAVRSSSRPVRGTEIRPAGARGAREKK